MKLYSFVKNVGTVKIQKKRGCVHNIIVSSRSWLWVKFAHTQRHTHTHTIDTDTRADGLIQQECRALLSVIAEKLATFVHQFGAGTHQVRIVEPALAAVLPGLRKTGYGIPQNRIEIQFQGFGDQPLEAVAGSGNFRSSGTKEEDKTGNCPLEGRKSVRGVRCHQLL